MINRIRWLLFIPTGLWVFVLSWTVTLKYGFYWMVTHAEPGTPVAPDARFTVLCAFAACLSTGNGVAMAGLVAPRRHRLSSLALLAVILAYNVHRHVLHREAEGPTPGQWTAIIAAQAGSWMPTY